MRIHLRETCENPINFSRYHRVLDSISIKSLEKLKNPIRESQLSGCKIKYPKIRNA